MNIQSPEGDTLHKKVQLQTIGSESRLIAQRDKRFKLRCKMSRLHYTQYTVYTRL